MRTVVIEGRHTAGRQGAATADKPALFQVWIDLEFGEGFADWWWNSPPKPLRDALEESAAARAGGWVCKVLPEGQNPRADGRWDNP
jgi:hypothetical protein